VTDPPRALHELDPLGRFSDRAADYRRHRPDYPAAAWDAVLDGLGDPRRLVAADIGAGTGISSRMLASRGVRVIAVEPNAGMRLAAEPHPLVEWREGSAESTGLDEGVVGLVVCAQAFHWFRPAEALREFHRVLAPRGRAALLWNVRDLSDPFTLGYTEVLREVSHDHPAESRAFDSQSFPASEWFGPARAFEAPHAQVVDLEGLAGRALSASYVPREPADLALLNQRLAALWGKFRDAEARVTLRYRTVVFLAERD
jgi:SAM-dependent methyltransferase